MMKKVLIAMPIILAIAFIALRHPSPSAPLPATSTQVSISISPTNIIQGDPAEITVNGTSTIRKIIFNGKNEPIFNYQGRPTALVGIGLKTPAGSYPVSVTLGDGEVVKSKLVVRKRIITTAPLGIPAKLGGTQNAAAVIAALAGENKILKNLPSASSSLWIKSFTWPLSGELTITDPYGYTRLTGGTTVSHLGTDFRAATGTPVLAMNSGVVVLSRFFTDYGNIIVIDHGLGLQTLYLHLSERFVMLGDKVSQGEVIGKTGDTGYAAGPHLHISVKINGVSIDPMKFMSIFGENVGV